MSEHRYYWSIRLPSAANLREHWAARYRRTKQLRLLGRSVRPAPLPCIVTITRVAPRRLDDDNMVAAAKPLRDGIADSLGVDDADPAVTWRYAQRRAGPREYGVEVCITSRP